LLGRSLDPAALWPQVLRAGIFKVDALSRALAMTTDITASTRRDFLTGRAAGQELMRAGTALADAVVDAGEHRPVPRGYDTIRLETRAMACSWSVILDPGLPQRVMLASDALAIVHELEAQLSVYLPDSEMSRINASAAAAPQFVEPKLFDLLRQCREFAVSTQGAFDPAVRGLVLLWRQCRRAGRVPTQREIDDALAATGMSHVVIEPADGTIAFDRPGVGFDLGAIGKGYAVDRAVDRLDQHGMPSFLIHGGLSSLYARGEHHGQGGWPVGIRDPLFTEERYATLLLRDRGMATSGSNIQYFRYQGRRYGHILDPRTGWPAEGLLSVTVIAPSASAADALSTALYVMGLENALTWCDNHPEIGVILIPPPPQGRRLEPVVRNVPSDVLFFQERTDEG
jgi:thiamine biosynthesis lipoprotein